MYQDLILPMADICLPNQFEAELLTGESSWGAFIPASFLNISNTQGMKITNEKEAIAVMEVLHAKGVSTVILSR